MQNASNPPTNSTYAFIRSANARVARTLEISATRLNTWRFPILTVLSVLYFWTTAFRAEKKLYWLDEICTVQISGLANLQHIWTALIHGADFNPPLIYLLTGLSQHVLGNTSLAARMPEIIAFWIFCLSAYVFTYRFAGASGALTAFLFPSITIAYWYSYEARPHALVLGFAGLAVLCWQRAQTSTHRPWWLIGLGLSLGLVLLSHAFGIVVFFPIAAAEIVDFCLTRRLRPGGWIAMICGGSAILVSLVLLRTLKAEHLTSSTRPGVGIIVHTYLFILAPAGMVLGLTISAIYLPWHKLIPSAPKGPPPWPPSTGKVTSSEVALMAGFVLIPFVSFLLAFLNRAPLFTRYGLEAVFGFASALALAAIRRPGFALAIPAIIALQYAYDFGSFRHQLHVEEPVTSLQIDASLSQYSKRYDWMETAGHPNLPIVLIDDLDFSPTIYYAPPDLQRRMIFGWNGNGGVNAAVYSQIIRLTGAPGRVIPLNDVVGAYPSFFLFATNRQSTVRPLQDNDTLNQLLPAVQTITLLQAEADMELFLVQSKRP
ncbi:MAG: glycosyltransferase family 39 protein [Bryobacteraceae bacterium]